MPVRKKNIIAMIVKDEAGNGGMFLSTEQAISLGKALKPSTSLVIDVKYQVQGDKRDTIAQNGQETNGTPKREDQASSTVTTEASASSILTTENKPRTLDDGFIIKQFQIQRDISNHLISKLKIQEKLIEQSNLIIKGQDVAVKILTRIVLDLQKKEDGRDQLFQEIKSSSVIVTEIVRIFNEKFDHFHNDQKQQVAGNMDIVNGSGEIVDKDTPNGNDEQEQQEIIEKRDKRKRNKRSKRSKKNI